MTLLALAILLSVPRLPQPQIESYGFPIYFRRSIEKPAPIKGYVWVEHNYGMQSKVSWDDPGWALYRTTLAPPNNKELFKRLGVSGPELWSLGRQDDTDWRP